MSRHIGIVGVSPEGATLFYRAIARHAGRLLSPTDQPRITVHNEPLALYIEAIRKDNWVRVGELLRQSAEIVQRAGAEVCMTPDNAVQHAIPLAEAGSSIPWITMTELVAAAISRDARTQVGVIGTKLITRSSTYQMPLGLKGIQVVLPEDREVDQLEEIIYGELIYGDCRPESRLAVYGVIENLARRGCDGVILGCSEAPLVVTAESSMLPVYDPGDILAEVAVRRVAGLPSEL
mgnify:CR=1 FL=1